MLIIGITGKSGSGKSTIANRLSKELKCEVIDIDEIGHYSIQDSNIKLELCNKFGKEILNENNQINRKKLGSLVFNNEKNMNDLIDITWEYMKNYINDKISKSNQTIILDWALLPKTEFWEESNLKILVEAEYNVRKEKVLNRDNITEEYFEKRENSSINYDKYNYDLKLKNKYKEEQLQEQIKNIIEKIKQA